MANNQNAQGHRYQEKVNKYKLAHIAAGGDGWAEAYRAEGLAKKQAQPTEQVVVKEATK